MKESRTGILGGTKACLCKDNTYSIDCCNGSLTAQGFGSFQKSDISVGEKAQNLPEGKKPTENATKVKS